MSNGSSLGPCAGPLDGDFADNVIQRWAVLFRAYDRALLTELMTQDVVLELEIAPPPLGARAEGIDFYTTRVWKAFPDLPVELSDGPSFDPHAPCIAIGSHRTGTHTGLLDPPGVAATGKSSELRAWEMIEFRGGQASRLVQVFDAAAVMRQVGVVAPAPATN